MLKPLQSVWLCNVHAKTVLLIVCNFVKCVTCVYILTGDAATHIPMSIGGFGYFSMAYLLIYFDICNVQIIFLIDIWDAVHCMPIHIIPFR